MYDTKKEALQKATELKKSVIHRFPKISVWVEKVCGKFMIYNKMAGEPTDTHTHYRERYFV